MDNKHKTLFNNIITIYWIAITSVYLVISFITGLWAFTWIIMLVASIFHFVLKAIFEHKYGAIKEG